MNKRMPWDDLLDTLIENAPEASERVEGAPEPRGKELWRSRLTGRRGIIQWVFSEKVCIAFNEEGGAKIHIMSDFLRLYRKV